MKLFTKIIAIICFVSFFAATQSQAQEKKFVSGNSVTFGFPVGDMESLYDFGWGIYADFDYNFSKFLIARFDLGWNTFSGTYKDELGLDVDRKQDIWEFTGGLRAKIAMFYVEGRGGYFTGINEWGVVPAVGIRLGKIDIQGSLTVAGDYHWGGARIAYYWGNK